MSVPDDLNFKKKKLSGAENRKRKAAREQSIKSQSGALFKFLKPESKESCDVDAVPITSASASSLTVPDCGSSAGNSDTSSVPICEGLREYSGETITSITTDVTTEIPNDPGNWPEIITDKFRQDIVKTGVSKRFSHDHPFPQNSKGRKFSVNHYKRTLCNGETTFRSWLVYSPLKDAVFCHCCKLFSTNIISLTSTGYNDWGHLSVCLSEHEKSQIHLKAHAEWVELANRLQCQKTIDESYQKLIDAETRHWRAVLERLVSIVHFLGQQCLPFRGTDEKLYKHNNGNFLKLVELMAKFDDVMSDHVLRVVKNPKPRQTHYLSKDIQNELISLISNAIKSKIVSMLHEAKYYSIIADCTPDVSRVEQMSLTVRFVNTNPNEIKIQEHFIGFIPLEQTTGEALTKAILTMLSSMNISVQNMRGQGYDNGANMKGKNVGVQKRILDINPRAFFMPCTAHSLNLVVNDAAMKSTIGVAFFNNIQKLYVFFSASTHRWAVLKKHVTSLTLKPLSETRWEARIDAIRPLRYFIKEVCDALFEVADDNSFDRIARHEAESLANNICQFKFLCCLVVWHDILNEINILSKMLQKITVELASAVAALDRVTAHLKSFRNDEKFNSFLVDAKTVADSIGVLPQLQTDFPLSRVRRTKKQFNYETGDDVTLDPKTDFKVNFYFFTLDVAIASLEERFQQMKNHSCNFDFLYGVSNIKSFPKSELIEKCEQLQEVLTVGASRDIDAYDLADELIVISNLVQEKATPMEVLKYALKNDFAPNVSVALRILLTLPITVASGERSFSKLKLIKTYLRSTMSEMRLDDLATISIEHEIGGNLDYSNLVKDFAAIKARRMCK